MGRQQHDKEMEKECYEEKVQQYRKTDYKHIIIMAWSCHSCEFVVPYVPRGVLMSAEFNLLTVPPRKPGKYGYRSFAKPSANLWNNERADWQNSPTLESFKRNLKTILFRERFLS